MKTKNDVLFTPATKYMSIVIPAFNEEKRIEIALNDIFNYMESRACTEGFTYEIVCVDDGSTDATVEIVSSFVDKYGSDKIKIIKSGLNYGKGHAVKIGMLAAKGALLLFADADGATKINDLEKLELKIKSELKDGTALSKNKDTKYVKDAINKKEDIKAEDKEKTLFYVSDLWACAFGSRAHLERIVIAKRKWYRNLMMYVFHFVVLIAVGPSVKDSQCGFKMFTRRAARLLFPNQRLKRWSFDVELIYLSKRFGIPISEVGVAWHEVPGSKIRITSIMHILLELFIIRLCYGFRIWTISA